MIKRSKDLRVVYNEHMKGGDGTAKIIHYAEKEEIFYIAKGTAAYYDDGQWVTLHEGDSAICLGSQTHSIANRSNETTEVIATVLLYK